MKEIECLWILLNVYIIPFWAKFIGTAKIIISEIKFPFCYVLSFIYSVNFITICEAKHGFAIIKYVTPKINQALQQSRYLQII